MKRCFFTSGSAVLKRDFQDVYSKNLLALFYKLSEYGMLTFNTCLTLLMRKGKSLNSSYCM